MRVNKKKEGGGWGGKKIIKKKERIKRKKDGEGKKRMRGVGGEAGACQNPMQPAEFVCLGVQLLGVFSLSLSLNRE